jgi:hypothetical protein
LVLHDPTTGATLDASVQLFVMVGAYGQNCDTTQFVCSGARCTRSLSISKSVVNPSGGQLDPLFDDVDVQLEVGGVDVGNSTGLVGSWSQADTVSAACNSPSLRFDYTLTIIGEPGDWDASWSGDAASATFVFDCNTCDG